MYPVEERDVPEQPVLTEQRRLTVGELPEWMSAALGRLFAAAEDRGLQTGEAFAIFHGAVNDESDGPVECCVPVLGGHLGTAGDEISGVATRVEPAHREAYTTITVGQTKFPEILGAYEAVAAWAQQNGCEITGPPREVYRDRFAELSADEPGCDIAFPIR
jgi:effector-binding domain-containing protein